MIYILPVTVNILKKINNKYFENTESIVKNKVINSQWRSHEFFMVRRRLIDFRNPRYSIVNKF